jgi:tRNA(Ile)-lysidine synthase
VAEAFGRAEPKLQNGSVLIVAVSGGPDSVCLLHALHAHVEEMKTRGASEIAGSFGDFKLHVAHLHHGQRPEAEEDAAYVRGLAESLGLPFTLGRADVPGLARDEKLSLEAAGRAARYRFLHRLAADLGAAAVATGHNADDQTETVLLRAFRGAGTRGLRGIPEVGPMPESNGNVTVIRPLLHVPRTSIDAYLSGYGLAPRLDSTNLDPRIQRNRLRRELLPLAESISPGAKSGLLRIAKEAAEDEGALRSWVDTLWKQSVRAGEGRIEIPFDTMPEQAALRRRMFRRAIETLLSEEGQGFPEAVIDEIMCVCNDASAPCVRPLTARLDFKREHDPLRNETHLVFQVRRAVRDTPRVFSLLPVPGTSPLPELCREWVAEVIPVEDSRPFPYRESWEAVVDADTLNPPFLLRTWEPGDRLRVLGTGGTKKLQDLFTDAKIPRSERHHWPVLCDGPDRRVIWVPGLALHDGVKVTLNTRRVYRWKLLEWDGQE